MTNKTYDILKWIAQLFLPALATLYIALAQVWDLPYPEAFPTTIIALDTFLGAILGISTSKYNKDSEE